MSKSEIAHTQPKELQSGDVKPQSGSGDAAHVYGSESPSMLGKIWSAMSSVGSHVADNAEKVLSGHGTVLNDLELVGEVAAVGAAAGAVGIAALGAAAGAAIGSVTSIGAAEGAVIGVTSGAIGGGLVGGFGDAVFEGTNVALAGDVRRFREEEKQYLRP